jgi:hypothetical protein
MKMEVAQFNMATLIKRSDKLAFLDVSGEYKRMTGFTALTTNKNPKEYTRQYVDEDFENTDVTGYSPSIDFTFDQYTDSAVHEAIVALINNDTIGTPAIVSILTVDKSDEVSTGSYTAWIRDYAVVGGTEGDSMDAYTYSGTFKVKGSKTTGTATLNVGETVATFTAGGVSV